MSGSVVVGGWRPFLAIAFVLAWAPWTIGLWVTGLSGAALLGLSGQAVVLSGAFAPAVAAFVVYPLLCALLSVFLGWAMGRSGSVWVPSLAHSAHNTVFGWLLISLVDEGSNLTIEILLVLVPYAALCAWMVLARSLGPPRVETRSSGY